MPQLGVLQVASRGGRRFRILSRQADAQGLIRAQVQWLAEEPKQPLPAERAGLLPLLRAIAEEAGEARIPQPHVFDDAVWVGYRFAEVLPIPLAARQKLLELDDSLIRLEIIQTYLQQKGVL
jgi:Lon protease-like protein